MQITSLDSKVIVTDHLEADLEAILKKYEGHRQFVFVDENTRKHCLPVIENFSYIKNAEIIETASGESNKSIDAAIRIWKILVQKKADRKSLVINLGGGLLCDLGGFAASTFKRGVDFINIPTTLLSQVDASIGGKLGINFEGFKNEVGIFKVPNYVIIDTVFLNTLDADNLLSGYAEMIKHALIYDESHFKKVKDIDFNNPNFEILKKIVAKSIFIKNDFVQNDPVEKNIRKALNFGHTIGHAFESYLIEKETPVLHGIAVAYGIICELYLSNKKLGFDPNLMQQIESFIKEKYPLQIFPKNKYEELYELMTHDKKNENNVINFTLLSAIGEVEINTHCKKEEVFDSFDHYNEVCEISNL